MLVKKEWRAADHAAVSGFPCGYDMRTNPMIANAGDSPMDTKGKEASAAGYADMLSSARRIPPKTV